MQSPATPVLALAEGSGVPRGSALLLAVLVAAILFGMVFIYSVVTRVQQMPSIRLRQSKGRHLHSRHSG